MKKLILIAVALLIILAGFYFYYDNKSTTALSVSSFEDCAKAGYPIMESYPEQCRTPDGRTFVREIKEKITYVNSTADNITVDNPFPGAVTGKTFTVMGKARGSWYFEASFPILVLDKDGKTLAQGIAQAQSDWMTTEFVPFKANVKVPESYIGKATLILKKDNPSGLVEKDASISFPFTIEY